jgi:hypothetical protein
LCCWFVAIAFVAGFVVVVFVIVPIIVFVLVVVAAAAAYVLGFLLSLNHCSLLLNYLCFGFCCCCCFKNSQRRWVFAT